MKKLFFFVAFVSMSMLSVAQVNQLVWANGRLLYGTPIESIDSLTYDEMEDVDTLHLLLPRTLIKVVHDTVYIHDTVYVETDCGDNDTPSAGIGVFSVSADKQVTFSKGNLQYHPANDEWRFAENQTGYIGEANSNISATYNGWIDLFGWGTGNAPTKSSTDYSDYQSFVDWGTNKIGADAPNTWRTLTKDEWVYLFNTRTNASSLYGVAQVNGVNGMVVLPDDWTCPEGVTFKSGLYPGSVSDYSVYQSFTTEQWSKMEQAGAVFLPASGDRWGTDVSSVGSYGSYWSSTEYNESRAYYVGFNSIYLSPRLFSTRYNGFSVRLVKDLEDETTEPETPTNTENGHEYVDLGLPSGLKWATCNVGASQPEEYGDYFAWGEVEPKEVYDWSTYKWGNSNETQTKYCTDSNYGTVDNKTVLESADDAATANWGGAWRMPTYEELDELLTKCTWIVATMNGVDGCKVIGPNGNSIFLPSAGYRQGGSSGGREGTYWSSSLYAASNYANEINSRSDGTAFWNFGPRCYGNSIRPVCE